MSLFMVLGAPGSGRSTALQALARAGYRPLDDVAPADLAPRLADEEGDLAVALSPTAEVAAALRALDAAGQRYQLLFLDSAEGGPAEQVLGQGLAETRERAHHRLPWHSRPEERQRRILGLGRRFLPRPQLLLVISSFGFKYGLPPEADWVLDVRFTPNPYWDPDLRPLTGLDAPVRAFVEADPHVARLVEQTGQTLSELAPAYLVQGRFALSVAIGCTGGRHRSVVIAEELARRLRAAGQTVEVEHTQLPGEPGPHAPGPGPGQPAN